MKLVALALQVSPFVVMINVLAPGCRPPDLPCDKPEWKAICAGGATGGSGGGTAGSGGTAGGSGGAPMDAYPDVASSNTPIADCEAYKTLGEMDKFFQTRCANMPACHTSPQLFGDYKSEGVWMRLVGAKTMFACPGSYYADPGGDPSKSVIWAKTQEKPTCPNGAGAGARMPNLPAAPLNAAETKCLENFLKALPKPKP